MDVNPVANARSAECILCGKCAEICPHGSIKICFHNKC
ncbi:MAG: 4Fe-4S binding protein [Treponemataceae bacterium]|nr:4Fe-4S binding protein [Treponemataceae bacterium]